MILISSPTNNSASEFVIHGTFLTIYEVGTLLTGPPGSGKSELALSLLSRSHQLVADDAPLFIRNENTLIGRNPLSKSFLSVRGIGLIDVNLIFGPACIKPRQKLDLIIQLQTGSPSNALGHITGQQTTKDVAGCLIPCVTIPIINPRNLEVIVETIVKRFLLTFHKEIDPVTNFEELLQSTMESNC